MKSGIRFVRLLVLAIAITLTACAGDQASITSTTPNSEFFVSVYVTQLDNSQGSLVLKLAQEAPITITDSGPYQFATTFVKDDTFLLSIEDAPLNQQCAIDDQGSFLASINGKILDSNIEYSIVCANLLTVGGIITGLPNDTVFDLTNSIDATKPTSSTDSLAVTITGNPTLFTFAQYLSTLQSYHITAMSPAGYNCQITAGSGETSKDNIDNIIIDCIADTVAEYAISGQVTGLEANTSGLTWSINGTNTALSKVKTNGVVEFATRPNGSYTIALIDPMIPNQNCSIQQGAGSASTSITVDVSDANVSNLSVNCVTPRYDVSVNVNNATTSFDVLFTSIKESVSVPITIDSTTVLPFTFAPPLFSGSDYTVSITSQPIDQTCSFETGNSVTGTISNNAVVTSITCANYASIAGVVNQLNETTQMGLILTDSSGATVAIASTTGTKKGVSAFSLTNVPLNGTYTLGYSVVDHSCNFSAASTGTASQDKQTLQLDMTTVGISGVIIDCVPDGIPLTRLFADANLQACIDKLGLKFARQVTTADCTHTGVVATTKIADLTGMEMLLNITSLNLSGNSISIITPLTGLTLLSELDLSNNQMMLTTAAEFTDINALTALTKLNLSNTSTTLANNITLFGFNLPASTDLNLDFNAITALSANAFSTMQNLQRLSMQGNGLANIDSSVSMLSQLSDLNLADNQITDATSLSALNTVSNFTSLNLANNQIADMTPLSQLPQLLTLDVSNNVTANAGPANIASLVSLINATSINVSNYTSANNIGILCPDLQLLISALNNTSPVVTPTSVSAGTNCKSSANNTTQYAISGTITNDSLTGLTLTGLQLDLRINGMSNQTWNFTNGSTFDLAVYLPTNGTYTYDIAVSNQPTDELFCKATIKAGPAALTGDVSGVVVDCVVDPLVVDIATFNNDYGMGIDVFNACISTILRSLNPTLNGPEYTKLTGGNVIYGNSPNKIACTSTPPNISNLYGLQFLDQITKLIISGQKLADIEIISSMRQLKELDLSDNQITTLPSKINTLNLASLTLFKNQIKDISPLNGMVFDKSTALLKTSLVLANNEIINALPLSTLSNIEYISLFNQKDQNDKPTLITLGGNFTDVNNVKRPYLGKLANGNNMILSDSFKLSANPRIPCLELEAVIDSFLQAPFQPAPALEIVLPGSGLVANPRFRNGEANAVCIE